MDGNRLSSRQLAELIVDALIDGGCVPREQFDHATGIVAEEIDARKAVGDY